MLPRSNGMRSTGDEKNGKSRCPLTVLTAGRNPAARPNNIRIGNIEGGGYFNAEARLLCDFLKCFCFRRMRLGDDLLHLFLFRVEREQRHI